MTDEFFVDDNFYIDIGSFIDDVLYEYEEDLSDLQENWQIECIEAELQPLVTIDKDWFYDRIDEDRMPEDSEHCDIKLAEALDLIPYDKVMEVMPKLYYPTRNKFILTKRDLLDYIN